MEILIQFLLRAAFGLAFAIACTSPRMITSGYYRNHLFVVLGMLSLAAMVITSHSGAWTAAPAFWLSVAGCIVGYFGTVSWFLERKRSGKAALWLVAACSLGAAWAMEVGQIGGQADGVSAGVWAGLVVLEPFTSGLMLGFPLASMLLGHWYLNSPGMDVAPLDRLLGWQSAAVCLRIVVCGAGLAWWVAGNGSGVTTTINGQIAAFLVLRWVFGLLGVLALTWMARQTLRIPNTQSATGILYVSVIGVFSGELASLLLSDLLGCPV